MAHAPTSVSPGLCVELQDVRLCSQGRAAEREGTARAGLAARCLLSHPGCCPGELSLALRHFRSDREGALCLLADAQPVGET